MRLRAVIELAASDDGPVKGERIAQAQEIPLKFENILGDLRYAGIVRQPARRRGPAGEPNARALPPDIPGPATNLWRARQRR